MKNLSLSAFISFTLLFLFLLSNSSKANIQQIECQNPKNALKVVFSHKRKQAIITKINESNVKIKFAIQRSVGENFTSKGVVGDLKTNLDYNSSKNELSFTQASLRGKNYFMKCSFPKILKKE